MGYTHYWDHEKAFTDVEWADIVSTYEKLLQSAVKKGINISITDDETSPSAHAIIAEKTRLMDSFDEPIYFNGVGDAAHETFVLNKNGPPRGSFDFCKTAYKPYDTLVTAMICFLESNYSDKFTASSDGEPSEWQEGLALAQEICPEGITLPQSLLNRDY